jgi:hypothetical protein
VPAAGVWDTRSTIPFTRPRPSQDQLSRSIPPADHAGRVALESDSPPFRAAKMLVRRAYRVRGAGR